MLIDNGAPVDQLTNFGDTALHRAVIEVNHGQDCRIRMIKLLLKHGADVEIKSNEGLSAIEFVNNATSGEYYTGEWYDGTFRAKVLSLFKSNKYEIVNERIVAVINDIDTLPVVAGYKCPKCDSFSNTCQRRTTKGLLVLCNECDQKFINGAC